MIPMIPWYYKAGAAALALGLIFGYGYWRGYKRGTKAMAVCEAQADQARRDMKGQADRLESLNQTLKQISERQMLAIVKAGEAADAARAGGRTIKRPPIGDCPTTAKAMRTLAPDLAAEYRKP